VQGECMSERGCIVLARKKFKGRARIVEEWRGEGRLWRLGGRRRLREVSSVGSQRSEGKKSNLNGLQGGLGSGREGPGPRNLER